MLSPKYRQRDNAHHTERCADRKQKQRRLTTWRESITPCMKHKKKIFVFVPPVCVCVCVWTSRIVFVSFIWFSIDFVGTCFLCLVRGLLAGEPQWICSRIVCCWILFFCCYPICHSQHRTALNVCLMVNHQSGLCPPQCFGNCFSNAFIVLRRVAYGNESIYI